MRYLSGWLGPICVAITMVGLGILTAVTHSVSGVEGDVIAGGSAAVGVVLWLASFATLITAIRDRRVATDPIMLAVAQIEMLASVYRLAGKTAIVAALVLVYLARFHDVLLWVHAYPLALYGLLVLGVFIFTVGAMVQLLWRRRFRARFDVADEGIC